MSRTGGLKQRSKFFVGENLKSLFPRINFQWNIPTLKSEKVQGNTGYKSIFCYILSTDSSPQNVSAFFIETSILENMMI